RPWCATGACRSDHAPSYRLARLRAELPGVAAKTAGNRAADRCTQGTPPARSECRGASGSVGVRASIRLSAVSTEGERDETETVQLDKNVRRHVSGMHSIRRHTYQGVASGGLAHAANSPHCAVRP